MQKIGNKRLIERVRKHFFVHEFFLIKKWRIL
jgi:hypothetical protein